MAPWFSTISGLRRLFRQAGVCCKPPVRVSTPQCRQGERLAESPALEAPLTGSAPSVRLTYCISQLRLELMPLIT